MSVRRTARPASNGKSNGRAPEPPPAPPPPLSASNGHTHQPPRILIPDWAMALARIPAAMWVATAAHEGRRRSIRAVFVQQAAISPVLISVALPRGPTLAPLIRETGVLGLSLLSREERYMTKRWEDKRRGLDDLLDGPEAITLTTGVPLLKRALLVLEGRIVRHLDLEADHELFILQILGGRALNPESSPARRKRAHGLET